MDKIDGPYYFFGVLAKLRRLPSFTPMVLPDTGRTNIIPVDHVADALVVLMHADATVRPSLSPRRKPSDFGASTAASRERPGCRSCAAPCRGPLRRRS
jgi:thioester reductase-like protein